MKWPFILRSTHEARVKQLQDELHFYQEQFNRYRRTNVADIAEFIVQDFPALQQEMRENRDAFIGRRK